MLGANRTRRQDWAGALLVAVHLLAAVLLPLAHGVEDRTASDHVEAPGSHQHGHDPTACLVCRAADTRFLGGSPPAPVAAVDETVALHSLPYAEPVASWNHGAWSWIRGPPVS